MTPTQDTPTLTWPGGESQKAEIIAKYEKHIEHDRLIQGSYGKGEGSGDFKGCHIGCLAHDLTSKSGSEIEDMPSRERVSLIASSIGQPEWLTCLAEHFFERLPYPKNQTVSLEVLKSTPIGVDLTPVYHRFMIWLLTDDVHGSRQYADDMGKSATDAVVALHQKCADGINVDVGQWDAARKAAEAAAGSAARAAARDTAYAAGAATCAAGAAACAAGAATWAARAATCATRAAAWSAGTAARSAARGAARDTAYAAGDAAWAAAGSAAQDAQSKKLISLLQEFST